VYVCCYVSFILYHFTTFVYDIFQTEENTRYNDVGITIHTKDILVYSFYSLLMLCHFGCQHLSFSVG